MSLYDDQLDPAVESILSMTDDLETDVSMRLEQAAESTLELSDADIAAILGEDPEDDDDDDDDDSCGDFDECVTEAMEAINSIDDGLFDGDDSSSMDEDDLGDINDGDLDDILDCLDDLVDSDDSCYDNDAQHEETPNGEDVVDNGLESTSATGEDDPGDDNPEDEASLDSLLEKSLEDL